MKPKLTLILLVLVTLLGLYLYFVDSKFLGTEDAAKLRTKIAELDKFERGKAQRFTIRNTEGTFEFSKKDGIWMMDAPLQDRADDRLFTELFTALETLRVDRVADGEVSQELLKTYGLADVAETSVKVAFEGKTVEVLVGKDAGIEGKL
jgi:hypothetical protein